MTIQALIFDVDGTLAETEEMQLNLPAALEDSSNGLRAAAGADFPF